MRKSIFPFVLAAVILLIVGCPSPSNSSSGSSGSGNGSSGSGNGSSGSGNGSSGSGTSGGSLTINLPLIPLTDPKHLDPTAPAFYDVSGSGPGNASFLKPGIRDSSVTIGSLAPGDWGVTVNANNYIGLQIASAKVQVSIVEGETASTDVAVRPSVGDGNLDLSLEWPAAMGIAFVSAFLTPEGGGLPYTITLPSVATTNGVSSVAATAVVPAGYYTMSRVFIDSAKFASGGADAVRITSGSSTKLAVKITSSVSVTITPDISNVIRITFTGWKPIIGQGEVITVTAAPTISKKFNSFAYQWYLNGGALDPEAGNPITLSAKNLPSGSYRLDCVVAANGVLSSDHVSFSITGN